MLLLRSPAPLLLGLVAVLSTLAAGCGEGEPPPPAATPVASSAANLAFSDLPAGFVVESNDSEGLRIRTDSEGRSGEMWVEASERSDFGIDLVSIVNAQKDDYETREGGEYSGGRKLMTPVGEAYYVRGRYLEGSASSDAAASGDPALVEESRVYLVHPVENRLVVFHYRYPAAEDSADRLNELFGWVSEIDLGTDTSAETNDPDPNGGA